MGTKKDISNLDIDQLVQEFITPIDKIRSQSRKEGYLESRLNAFYRMIGFPVVSTKGDFYSPGYNLQANLDTETKGKHIKIIEDMRSNRQFCSQQLDARENIFRTFAGIFSIGGFDATALALGSIYVRSFEHLFGATGPFEFDSSQIQSVGQRESELRDFYNNDSELESYIALKSSGLIFSNHILKPFVVDPRIDDGALDNLISSPFPEDASKIKKFDGTYYPRPYIERVISIRLSNTNVGGKPISISDLIAKVKKDETVIDAYLLSVQNNPQKEMLTGDVVIFGTYLKLLRSLINRLVECAKDMAIVRRSINFQPQPDKKLGVEGQMTIAPVIWGDIHNGKVEDTILNLYTQIALQQSSHIADPGTNGSADTGGYVFSGIDDSVFSADKSEQASAQKEFERITKIRERGASEAFAELRNIEFIMGEFSGLGLIDIVAIQAAFWLVDRDKLLGMIDEGAYARIKSSRPQINTAQAGRDSDIESCLRHYEQKLKEVYSIVQLHFDQVWNGKAFSSS